MSKMIQIEGFFESLNADIPVLITLKNAAQLATGAQGSFHAVRQSLPMNPKGMEIIYAVAESKFNVRLLNISTSEWEFEVESVVDKDSN